MKNNKFLISFNLPNSSPLSRQGKVDYAWERTAIQNKMRAWCIERLGVDESYPNWQFQEGYEVIIDDHYEKICSGIYIFDEEARVAFKLTFGV